MNRELFFWRKYVVYLGFFNSLVRNVGIYAQHMIIMRGGPFNHVRLNRVVTWTTPYYITIIYVEDYY